MVARSYEKKMDVLSLLEFELEAREKYQTTIDVKVALGSAWNLAVALPCN